MWPVWVGLMVHDVCIYIHTHVYMIPKYIYKYEKMYKEDLYTKQRGLFPLNLDFKF